MRASWCRILMLFLAVSIHMANAPFPSPKARTTASCARPQKFMDERNELIQSVHC